MGHPLAARWPLFDLVVRTPRLELRYPDDEILVAVGDLAAKGIHPPDVMPFGTPWTDLGPPELQRQILLRAWQGRAGLSPAEWRMGLVVVVGGEVAGMQGINASEFGVRREVATGSWLGEAWQGHGIGREMRAAALHLAFAGLGALSARSGAFDDNAASLAVSRACGYEEDGDEFSIVRDRRQREIRFRMTRDQWEQHRRTDIDLIALEPCLTLLGAAQEAVE